MVKNLPIDGGQTAVCALSVSNWRIRPSDGKKARKTTLIDPVYTYIFNLPVKLYFHRDISGFVGPCVYVVAFV